jgi:hypothetical protein
MIGRIDSASTGYVVYAHKKDQYERAKRDWEKAPAFIHPA